VDTLHCNGRCTPLKLTLTYCKLIEHNNKRESVECVTFEQVWDKFKAENEPPERLLIPPKVGEIFVEAEGWSSVSTLYDGACGM